ncbi:M20/M25/M40 family metallo-hydrolase [Halobacillus sp. GSS1]|uniref:M20/M25/M40 family metallo-hydrolase n=1 Tax=Halobacillus sp. GSS1 TaxID=2815919 RepID=UPI001A8FCBF4|nr:M20/M25/M40 family metallo-hydrolase [Halobacillus sp. GSS1]MBN9655037.1 M20/M25/M40 family metallo-hydrolase [Halobacillus sp. GSS1]
MKKKISLLLMTFVFGLLPFVGSVSADPVTYHPSLVHKDGAMAYEHMQYLADEIGPRVAGTDNEREAARYIQGQFERMGLETDVQEFNYSGTKDSSNVVAYKEGKSTKQIIVGAHYDSVSSGVGVDDNASGVGVLLETAEVLKNIKTPYSIVYIAFGAEEVGLQGSKYYADQMTEKEIKNTIGMINLDSLAAGDQMYVYGNAGEDGFIRDQALDIADKKKLDVETNPGLNPYYPAGTTGDWSDHAPFKAKGIPYGYLEATNWEIGDLDGYQQTVKHGEIWHTEKDTLAFIEEEFPGRIQEHLSTFSTLLTDLLKFMNKTSTSK